MKSIINNTLSQKPSWLRAIHLYGIQALSIFFAMVLAGCQDDIIEPVVQDGSTDPIIEAPVNIVSSSAPHGGVSSIFASIGLAVAIGKSSLYSNTSGYKNNAMGAEALYSNNGIHNNAMGYRALYSNTIGYQNNAMGAEALYSNTIGYQNNAMGINALYSNTNGPYNSAYGNQALNSNTTGAFNTALGYNADVNAGNLINATVIGANAIVDASNKIRLGNTNVTLVETDGTYVGKGLDINGNVKIVDGNEANGYVLTSDGSGNASWQSAPSGTILQDADTDTEVLVEESPDEDIIRFKMAGTEYFTMDNGRLAVRNTGNSIFIGEGAGTNDDLSNNNNVAIGEDALHLNTIGQKNVAVGYRSLQSNTTGSSNNAMGYQALYNNTAGVNNIANGDFALYLNTIGTNNTAIGVRALLSNTTGQFNTAIGANANVIGNLFNATAIGAGASVDASNKIQLGKSTVTVVQTAGTYSGMGLQDADTDTKVLVEESPDEDIIRFKTAGTEYFNMDNGRINVLNTGGSVFIGEGAGANDDLTDNKNVAIGDATLHLNTVGHDNVAIGNQTLQSNTMGSNNIAMGFRALYSNTDTAFNNAMGYQALYSNTDGYINNAMGYEALYSNTDGVLNNAMGAQALYLNTTGSDNNAMGAEALYSNTTGIKNKAIGPDALYANTTGSNNTAVGASTLYSNITGSYNTAIGDNADVSTSNLTNATAIGTNTIVDASNKIRLGDANVTIVETDATVEAGGLNITGNVKITDGTEANGYVLTSDASGNASWQTGTGDHLGNHTATTNIVLDGNWLSKDGDNEGLFVDAIGQVGIGTNNPGAKLEVNGTAEIGGTIKIAGGNPDAGKVLTSDVFGNATWEKNVSPKVVYTQANGLQQYDANNIWRTVTGFTPFIVNDDGAALFKLEGISATRLQAGFGADPFEFRIEIECDGVISYSHTLTYTPGHDGGNHEAFKIVPYLAIISPPCVGGNIRFRIRVRNIGDDFWSIKDILLIVTKY